MVNLIQYCAECNQFTLEKYCAKGHETHSPKPGKFSIEDRYGHWRRKYKEQNE